MLARFFPGLNRTVPVCGFGGWGLGGRAYGPVARRTAEATLQRFLELGGAFIDTAEAYGESEEIIGGVLAGAGARGQVVLATKTQHHAPGLIRRSLEQSLRRLRTEYVDVYQIHLPPDDEAQMESVIDAFEQLRAEGKVRLVGASIKGPRVTDETVALCRQYLRTGRINALQVIYSALRPRNAAVFAEAAAAGIAIIARTVLENGFLSGKFAADHIFPEGDHRNRWSAERRGRLLSSVARVSAALPGGGGIGQAAIRFALTPAEVSVVIPGATSPAQVEQNWRAAARGLLSAGERERLRREFTPLADDANPD